jgi:hypothetical protein
MSNPNPYAFDPNPSSSEPIYAADDLLIRRVAINPIELLSRSYALIREQYLTFVAIVMVGLVLGNLGPLGLVLLGPCMVGIHLSFIQRELGQRVEFGTLFKGFEFFVDACLAVLIIAGVSLLVVIPVVMLFAIALVMLFALISNAIPELALLYVGLIILFAWMFAATLIAMPFLFAFPLIADRALSGGQAVWIGWQGAKCNFLGICRFLFVMMMISMACVSLCYVPLILFMPILMGAQFLLYRDIFGPNLMLEAQMESSKHQEPEA